MKKIHLFFFFLISTLSFSHSDALKENIKKAYLLEKNKNYTDAKKLFLAFEKQNITHFSEKEFITVYLLFCDFMISEDLKKLDAALKISKKWDDRKPYQTELLLKIYSANYTFLNDKSEPKKAITKALEGYQIPDFNQAKITTQIQYLSDISALYRENKNPFEAVSFGEKALRLQLQNKGENSDEVAEYYNLLGDLYIESYNPTKANIYYQKAIVIWGKLYQNNPENSDKLLTAYRNLIRTLLEYGDFEAAKKLNDKQNALFFKQYKNPKNRTVATYFHSRQMYIHSNVSLNAALKNFEKATQYCDSLKTETSFKKENKDDIQFFVMRYFDIIDFTYEYENYQETISRCHQLESIAEQYDLGLPKLLINAKMGTSYEKIKAYEKALYHIKIAENVVDKERFYSSKFSIQIIKAMILSGMNKNEEAITIGKKTLEQIVFEKTKKNIRLDQIKFENVSDLADTYFINIFEKVADLYLNQYKSTKEKKSLKTAENLYVISGKLFQKYYAKGEFNDYLNYYHLEITEGLLQCLTLQLSSYEQKIKLLNSIENNASQHLTKEFEKKIKRSSQGKTEIHQKIIALQSELDYYLQQQTTDPKEIAFNKKKIKNLQSEVNLLTKNISKTEKNFAVFNATNFDLKNTLSHLKKGQQLIKYYVCRQFVYAVSFTNNDIVIKKIASSEELHEQLNEFIVDLKNLKPNYKKSTTALYKILIPFNLEKNLTLISGSYLNYLPFEVLMNPKTKQYTIESHFISYDYSLPMWELHQQYKNTKTNQSLAAFSPFYATNNEDETRSNFKDLKFATIESQKIVSLFDGDLFAKEKATKANFIKKKEQYDIFHLSMHSQLFEEDFNKSCLVFSNNEKLYFSDLYGMNIPTSMVVLSACDTGNGTIKNGEGIMSMSRALTYAGVKSAVVSLWQVSDKETAEIMISFYENLKKGQSKDEALANAKNIFIKNNPMKNHPYYWAGFIMNGDVSAIANKSYAWMMYVSFGLILLLFLVYRKKLVQFRK